MLTDHSLPRIAVGLLLAPLMSMHSKALTAKGLIGEAGGQQLIRESAPALLGVSNAHTTTAGQVNNLDIYGRSRSVKKNNPTKPTK